MIPLPCQRARQLAEERLDAALDHSSERLLDEHLASCADCRAYVEEAEELHGMLRGLPRLELPADALEEVFARTVGSERARRGRLRRARWVGLAAAAVLFLALVVPWIARMPHQGRASAPMSDTDLRAAAVQAEAVLGIAGRAINTGGARGVTTGFRNAVTPALAVTPARATEDVLERRVSPPLRQLPLFSSSNPEHAAVVR